MFRTMNDSHCQQENGLTPEQEAILTLFDQVAALRAEVDQMKMEKTLKVINGKRGQGRE